MLGTKLKWPPAPSLIFLISIRVNPIVIPRPLLPPLQLLSQRIKRHLPHLALLKHLIRLSNPRLLQIRQILKKRFQPAGLQAFKVIVSDGVSDYQRLIGGFLGIRKGEADKIVVVCAGAEESLLAPDGACVGSAVETGGRRVGG